MRHIVRYLAVALALTPISCADDARAPTEAEVLTVPVFNRVAAMNGRNFRAHAHGGEEVPAVDTKAQGQAIFQLSRDGDELGYKLIVANIRDVLMAHIHLAPPGQNGGVVVWLYPAGPPPQLIEGRSQGVLAEGDITSDDLVGALAGMELDALLGEMRAGNTYVNVHTVANPSGEIRGQIH